MTKGLVLAVLCATAAHAGSAGEAEHAARLEARVEAALERMLGPGRAAAAVEVRGERVTRREESSVSGSGVRAAAPEAAIVALPGYAKSGASRASRAAAGGPTLVHSASEETLREGSFTVSGVRARLIVDNNLAEGAVAEAVRVTGEILALDPGRGDELSVVKTSFLPAWRAAFSRPRDARALALLCLAAAALLLAAVVVVRGPAPASEALRAPAAPAPVRRISPLPPLEKGGRGP